MSISCLFRCRKSGWPVCGQKCEKKIEHNPEVVIPHQTGRYIFNQIQYAQKTAFHFVPISNVFLLQKM